MSEYLNKPKRTEEEARADVRKLHDPLLCELRHARRVIEDACIVYADYKTGTKSQQDALHMAILASDYLQIAARKLVNG